MTEIYLEIEGRLPRLRQWTADLQAGLGDIGRVRHSLEDGDEGEVHYRAIYVDVSRAESEEEALVAVQPILHPLNYGEDPTPLRGGTSTVRHHAWALTGATDRAAAGARLTTGAVDNIRGLALQPERTAAWPTSPRTSASRPRTWRRAASLTR